MLKFRILTIQIKLAHYKLSVWYRTRRTFYVALNLQEWAFSVLIRMFEGIFCVIFFCCCFPFALFLCAFYAYFVILMLRYRIKKWQELNLTENFQAWHCWSMDIVIESAPDRSSRAMYCKLAKACDSVSFSTVFRISHFLPWFLFIIRSTLCC